MPTVSEVKLAALIAAATASLETATANSDAATAASDAAYNAIKSAVAAAGHNSFEIGSTTVSVPARLRTWTAEGGIAPPGRVDVGLNTLVATWRSASATTTKRMHESEGLRYLIDEAKGLQASYPPVSEDDVLPGLQSMLQAIQASMVAP